MHALFVFALIAAPKVDSVPVTPANARASIEQMRQVLAQVMVMAEHARARDDGSAGCLRQKLNGITTRMRFARATLPIMQAAADQQHSQSAHDAAALILRHAEAINGLFQQAKMCAERGGAKSSTEIEVLQMDVGDPTKVTTQPSVIEPRASDLRENPASPYQP